MAIRHVRARSPQRARDIDPPLSCDRWSCGLRRKCNTKFATSANYSDYTDLGALGDGSDEFYLVEQACSGPR